MSLAVDSSAECLITEGAPEGPETAVDHHVTSERTIGGECCLADVTLVVLDTQVGLHVCLQHSRRYKHSVTFWTLEWLLTYTQTKGIIGGIL